MLTRSMFESGNYSELDITQTERSEDVIDFLVNNNTDNSLYTAVFNTKLCERWNELNHIYFQIANIFFLLSYLAPNGIYGMLYLRCSLLVGCIFFAFWSWSVKCYLDALVWNLTFVLINLVYICTTLFYMSPYKFQKEIEEVYLSLFHPLKVSRRQFKKVLECMRMIRTLSYQEVYAQEKATKVDSLSLVLSGKLVVSQGGRALHIVFPHQFLDSPEWFGVSTNELFQVTIVSLEESRILIWHRDKLKLSIINNHFMQAVFDHILGRDVVKKLIQVSEGGILGNVNGHLLSMVDPSNKTMLVTQKGGNSSGLTSLINRQIMQGGDLNSWRLGRIEETELETSV